VPSPRSPTLAADEGLTVLGWRDVPHNDAACGAGALEALPHLAQLFVAGEAAESGIALDRMAFCLRKRAEHETGVYFASLSTRTIVYKGMLSAPQVEPFFPDLSDERYQSSLALVALPLLHQHVPVLAEGRTRTATSRTTARSTPCRATGTGCAPARRCSLPR